MVNRKYWRHTSHWVVRLAIASCLVQLPSAMAQTVEARPSAFAQAQKLQTAENVHEAFLKYLEEPGGEFAAVSLARPKAREFLALLREHQGKFPLARSKLIEGDLLLATRDHAGALECYREVARHIANKSGDGWAQGLIPQGEYVVEPSSPPQGDSSYEFQTEFHGPTAPFQFGPGSHRDNWLLRRFIALEAWPEARQEFARMWQVHRDATRPHVIVRQTFGLSAALPGVLTQLQPAAAPVNVVPGNETPAKMVKLLVTPVGFNGLGLRFALDYAFFLVRQKEEATALQILLEPLLLIDLDRNPGLPNEEIFPEGTPISVPERTDPPVRFSGFGYGQGVASAGVSRKEFIRLVFGMFKTADREGDLTKALEARIQSGDNRLRRVLARIRSHQGQTDAALLLELAYITSAKFDPLTTNYRRGMILDEFQKNAEAVAALEQALALPFVPLKLPDGDEDTDASHPYMQLLRRSARSEPGFRHTISQDNFRNDVVNRLLRLYASLGETEKILELTLKQSEFSPNVLATLELLNAAAETFRTNRQEQRFDSWVRKQLSIATEPGIRANLQWLLGLQTDALESLASDKTLLTRVDWKSRFRAAGPEPWQRYLRRLVAVAPEDKTSLLELLELEKKLDSPEAIQLLEQLLDGETVPLFNRYKGSQNRTQFRNYYDLAYRLLRNYERQGHWEKLHALSLRIARGDKPFPEFDPSQESWRDRNGVVEDIHACLSLAVQCAVDHDQLVALSVALKNSRCLAPQVQIARRLAREKWDSKSVPDPLVADRRIQKFGWANLPAGVQAIASNENVLALAHDDRYVYSGHPWGVAVYDLHGQSVTRVALGDSVSSLLCLNGQLWVGGPGGLFRITPGTWAVAHQWLHEDLPANRRQSQSFPGPKSYVFDNSVYTLAADGDLLWIGMHRNVQVLNTRTLELRAYSLEELHLENWAGFERIVPDGRYVWADSRSGVRRYDRTTDAWSTFPKPLAPEHVRFLEIIDGQVYGNVHLNDVLGNRICRIDRETLVVTPLSLSAQKSEDNVNEPLQYFGKWKDKLVFGTGRPLFVFDNQAGELKLIEKFDADLHHALQMERRPPNCESRLSLAFAARDRMVNFERDFGRPFPDEWHLVTLSAERNATPDKNLINDKQIIRFLGSRNGRRLTQNPYEDWPDQYRDLNEDEGGLFLASNDEIPVRISAVPRTDVMSNDYATSLLFTGKQAWISTSSGITTLDAADDVISQFTRADGLCANGINNGVELDGKLYFAGEWGDSGGGLIVFDPKTAVFTSFHQADGMDTDKLDSVSVENYQLKLTYATEYLRGRSQGEFSYHQFPPGTFDPKTRRFTSGGEARLLKQREAEFDPQKVPREPLPFLGGFLNQRVIRNGKTYLCGTRGVVIINGQADRSTEVLTISPLSAKLIESPDSKWLADVERRKPAIQSAAELATALQDPNPYYRAQALASTLMTPMNARYLPLIASQITDSHVRVRSTASYLITQFADQERDRILPLLRKLLRDREPRIRAAATIALARHGELPDLRWIKEILSVRDGFGNFPFGATSNIGAHTSPEALLEAIAPLATPDIFTLMLESPPNIDSYDNATKVYPQLGRSLLRHPQVATLLLKAHDSERHNTPRRNFARDVFRFAGVQMLPTLHQALGSGDRVIRSNAARACGAIGDASSISPLIKSLELESGLSRASIVWALGELRAREALPALARLYVDAQNDAKQHGGAGFRFGQQAAVLSAQFDTLQNVDSIGAEWDELKSRTLHPIVDPIRQEELLEPTHILEAIGKIGASESQEFYRILAGDRTVEARSEAAEHLAECELADQPRNVLILKNLLTDQDSDVRIRAGASLLILGVTDGKVILEQGLNSADQQVVLLTLTQLSRISDPKQFEFSQERLKRIVANKFLGEGTRQAAESLLQRFK